MRSIGQLQVSIAPLKSFEYEQIKREFVVYRESFSFLIFIVS